MVQAGIVLIERGLYTEYPGVAWGTRMAARQTLLGLRWTKSIQMFFVQPPATDHSKNSPDGPWVKICLLAIGLEKSIQLLEPFPEKQNGWVQSCLEQNGWVQSCLEQDQCLDM